MRFRRSIEYPAAGLAAALWREGNILADLRVVDALSERPDHVHAVHLPIRALASGSIAARLRVWLRLQV
jgi:hypothetical protein